jgi:hypothetical protein
VFAHIKFFVSNNISILLLLVIFCCDLICTTGILIFITTFTSAVIELVEDPLLLACQHRKTKKIAKYSVELLIRLIMGLIGVGRVLCQLALIVTAPPLIADQLSVFFPPEMDPELISNILTTLISSPFAYLAFWTIIK